MKAVRLLSFLILLICIFQVEAQTARTVITLDGTSPERYTKPLEDSVSAGSSLGRLLSGIEAEFGPLDDPANLAEVENKLNSLEKSGILSQVARINRKYYASLIEMGFTTEEAMKIIIANPIVEFIKKEESEVPKKSRTLTLEMQ
ncbi:MAG: hypothetical protein ACFHWX_03095 [Bacteroidota bacterium]